MEQKEFIVIFSFARLHWDLESFFFLLYRFSSVKLKELNLWQAQNKSSNIYLCSSLKYSKGINKNAIFT